MWHYCMSTVHMGGPEEQWTPNPGSICATLCPLSNAHYVSLSESFYVYFMIDCPHLFWAARSSSEEHAKWLIYNCGFLCLTSASTRRPTSQETKSTCWCNLEYLIQTHNLELFHMPRCDYTAPISCTGGLESDFFCKRTEIYEKKCNDVSRRRKIACHLPSSLHSIMKSLMEELPVKINEKFREHNR